MLSVGDRIPAATVWTTPFESATLEQLVSDAPILLLFYLFDWSVTCTNELQLFRDRGDEFRAAGVQPYAASRDSPWTHVAWMQALDLDGLPLLSDWNAEATKGFDIAFEYRGLRDVSERSAFLIDRDGVVQGTWKYETGEIPDFDVLLAAAQAL
jgi:peroxiredoxin (alkyl hydroperoxide reductase subunit C)